MKQSRISRYAVLMVAGIAFICASQFAAADERPPQAILPPSDTVPTYLLHLPGIAGIKRIDRHMIEGLQDAGFSGQIETYDWTKGDPGIDALLARKRNDDEAATIAQKITTLRRTHSAARILLTSHSGGTGVAVWALEKLPPDIKVDTVLLLSSALSPDYDLTAALRHVSGKMYVFSSENDALVLGAGTKLFGTIDGVKTEAAGLVGFRQPSTADPAQYQKLIARPYQNEWMRYGNIGDHIGSMSRAFAAKVLEPLLVGAVTVSAPATQPVG